MTAHPHTHRVMSDRTHTSRGACIWRAVAVGLLTLITVSGCRRSNDFATPPTSDRATVIEVIDGDTLRLDISGVRESVRLIGINTPETKHPTKGVECFGPQASAFAEQLLPPGTQLRIERDAEARDTYRRLLLYVFLPTSAGERFVNLELVARGFAVPLSIEPNVRYRDRFIDAAFDAQQHSRGLWRACK